MPDLGQFVLFVAIGGLLGALGGLFGIGGGVIAIPVLVIFFHLSQQHAQGTALVMIAPTVLVGLRSYAQRGSLDRRVAVLLGLCAVSFTLVGALYATRIAGPELRYGFAAFTSVLAAYYAYRSVRSDAPLRARPAWGWTAIVGAVGGILSGLFSVGGASFAVPVLALVFGYAQTEAQALALALVAPGTIVGIVAYALAGDVDWWIGVPLAIGGAACVRFGVGLAHRLPQRSLRLLFCGLLVAASVGLFLK
jgi:uncharacterized protein